MDTSDIIVKIMLGTVWMIMAVTSLLLTAGLPTQDNCTMVMESAHQDKTVCKMINSSEFYSIQLNISMLVLIVSLIPSMSIYILKIKLNRFFKVVFGIGTAIEFIALGDYSCCGVVLVFQMLASSNYFVIYKTYFSEFYIKTIINLTSFLGLLFIAMIYSCYNCCKPAEDHPKTKIEQIKEHPLIMPIFDYEVELVEPLNP
jgi:hypothetical protein